MKSHGMYHVVKRKRLEPYPHHNKWMRMFDVFIVVVVVVGPLTALPQLYTIFAYENVQGVSLLTWLFSAVFPIPWLIYAIVHKEKPLIISSVLWMLVSFMIVIGVMMYS